MKLYIVPPPIGNLEDITLRALDVLRSVDAIACEDTRRTLKLLNRYEIRKPLISLHRHNERTRSREIVERIEVGASIALVSDAGTPGISDPGEHLVREAIAHNLPVEALPGANALLPALLLSGLATNSFLFAGFIDGAAKEQTEKLLALSSTRSTLVFYVAPHDLSRFLELTERCLGNRPAALARELTKIHEEVLRGTIAELGDLLAKRPLKGEMVLVVAGCEDTDNTPASDEEDWQELARTMSQEGISGRVIANVLFARYGIPRNRVKKFITHLQNAHRGTTEDQEVEVNER